MTNKVFGYNQSEIDPTEKEKLIKAVVAEIFSVIDMEVKSVLTPKQMVNLVRLGVYAKRYNSPTAAFIYQKLLTTVVSTDQKGGRGRRDLTDILKALISQGETQSDTKTRSIMQKLFR